ncbi:hypothetical protein D3C71_1977870 [compost metagenome]
MGISGLVDLRLQGLAGEPHKQRQEHQPTQHNLRRNQEHGPGQQQQVQGRADEIKEHLVRIGAVQGGRHQMLHPDRLGFLGEAPPGHIHVMVQQLGGILPVQELSESP